MLTPCTASAACPQDLMTQHTALKQLLSTAPARSMQEGTRLHVPFIVIQVSAAAFVYARAHPHTVGDSQGHTLATPVIFGLTGVCVVFTVHSSSSS